MNTIKSKGGDILISIENVFQRWNKYFRDMDVFRSVNNRVTVAACQVIALQDLDLLED